LTTCLRPACQRTMWRSNMAARKRGEESDFTTGNSELPPRDPLNESNIDADEASESLLCALTEMLDRVGQDNDDVDEIFSPFDVLPNTELLHQAEQKDEPLLQKVERGGSPKILNKQNPRLFCSKTRRAKTEVEVFTSTSLVSLVKLMHPYCLKLQVEKEEHPRRNKSLFSQEEVWKYERPTEESDEEINVVSDDEAPLKGTKEEEVGGKSGSGSLLKSVLLKGKSSREKKRVSFGPVLVASFDESEEEDFKEKNLNTSESTKTLEDASGSVLHPSALPTNEEVAQEEQEKKKGETKAKSLSLQEYRQLRLNRRPPVEKQRNYSTKWPSVPEVPKELTPILPLCRPDTTADYSTLIQQAPNLKEAKLHHHLHHRRLKSSKPEPRTSPSRPLTDDTARPSISKPESRKSPVKKPKLLSSDPPNPVLVPLPVPQTPSPPSESVSLHSSKHLHKIQNDSSAAPQVGSSEPKPNASPLNKDVKVLDTPLNQEIKAKLTEMPPHVCTESPQECSLSRTEAAEQSSGPDPKGPVKCPSFTQPLSQSPPSSEVHMMLKEQFPDSKCPSKEPEPPQTDCRENSAAIDSEQTSKSPLKPNMEPRKPLSTEEILKDVQTLEVPEPLFIEIVLSTQKNQPVRCKNLSLKSIQIIDPRPLPSRKARMSQVEPSAAQTSAQFYSYLFSDHDYCGSVDHSPLQAKQSSELTTPELMTQDSGAAGEGKDHISENLTSALLYRSDQTRTGSETDTSTDEAPQFSSRAAIEGEGRDDNRTALCSLPTPPPTPPVRGRSKRRYRRSPRSDSSSSSSSCSCSPKRPRYSSSPIFLRLSLKPSLQS
ncbi:hypothetical protein GOODEAATRI_005023, partial [Goodea atripinnis]